MNNPCGPNNDFSHLVANEVEITTETECELISKKPATKISRPFFESSDYLNGALYEEFGYCWCQNFTDIEIHVRIPDNIKSKQLKVNITSTEITVIARLDNNESKTILSGKLTEKCKATEAMWTITGQNKLNIQIDKMKEIWWKKLFEHETNEINTNDIDCSRPVNELSDDTQNVISQIQYEQHQKLKGEMTSEQIKQQEILRKAWTAEGSPFKGQPFDPNIVRFENSN